MIKDNTLYVYYELDLKSEKISYIQCALSYGGLPVISDDLKERVAFVHNNLETDHYIKNNREYLISWEKSKVDSPILDLIKFYQKEYMSLDFESLIAKYIKNYPLKDNEKKLFFIVISIPPVIDLEGEEIIVTRKIRKMLDYVFKTEQLVFKFNSNNEGI